MKRTVGHREVIGGLNTVLRDRFKKVPDRRVIIAAIRAKSTAIEVSSQSALNLGANVELGQVMGELGFRWDSSKGTYRSLESDDWRYIAYQAQITNDQGEISTAEGTADEYETSLRSENFPWAELTTN